MPIGRARLGHRLVGEGDVELVGGERRVGHRRAPAHRRPGATPPPTSSITSRSRLPIATSPTPGRSTSPVTVTTIVPGDSGVPTDRNQPAPFSMIAGTFASVSTLFARTGGASVSSSAVAISTSAARPLSEPTSSSVSTSTTPRRSGGRDPRERGPTIDDFEQRRLLAVQILGWSLHDRDRHVLRPAHVRELVDR